MIGVNKVGFQSSRSSQINFGANSENLSSVLEQRPTSVTTFEDRLQDSSWSKIYNEKNRTVFVSFPNMKDGDEYVIQEDGSVIKYNGWSNPEIISGKNLIYSAYVKNMGSALTSDTVEFTKEPNDKQEVSPAVGLVDLALVNKLVDFKVRLQDDNWESKYNKKTQALIINQNNVKDGIEYIIDKEGTVTELDKKTNTTTVIIENDEQMAGLVKNKGKQPKKSKGFSISNAITNVWQFFSMTGTMISAIMKGAILAGGAGASVLAGTYLFRSIPKALSNGGFKALKEVLKAPLKSIPTRGKVIAGVVAGLAFVGTVVLGKLNANEKTAVIEHKMNTGHRDN